MHKLRKLFEIRDSYDPADGKLLIEELFKSADQREFNFIALLIVPKWIVELHNSEALAQNSSDPKFRAWLYIAVAGQRMPVIESYIEEDLASPESVSLAAACYCIDNGTDVDRAAQIVKRWFCHGETGDPVLIQLPPYETAQQIMERYPELF